jgi:hypothetical protein
VNTPTAVAARRRSNPEGTPMLALYATLATFITDLRTRTEDRLTDEDGFTTVEWVVIGSIAFAMAVAIGAGLTVVANNYMGKIN